MQENVKNAENKYKNSSSILTKEERILIQLTKLLRLCDEEGYNDQTLNPARKLLDELKAEMKVRRISVTNGKIEYITEKL